MKFQDSEEVLIVAALHDYHETLAKADGLSVDKFTKAIHRKIFASMISLAEDGNPISPVSVAEHAGLNVSAIVDIQDRQILGTSGVPFHCKMVVEAWQKNQLIQVMKKVISEIDDHVEPWTIADKVTNAFGTILSETSSEDVLMPELFNKVMDDVLERFENKTPVGIKCGYGFIDRFTNGYKPGDLIIIGARTSIGKTTFALNQAVNMAVGETPIGFISIEMRPEELLLKIIGMRGCLDSTRLEAADATDKEVSHAASCQDLVSSLPLVIKYPQSNDPQQIVNQIKVLKSKYGIKACFVDYLQLMHLGGRQESRNQEVGKITGLFKQVALSLSIPIVLLSQLSRPPVRYKINKPNELEPVPRPTLTALRDSGSIEQDANIVILLHSDNPLEDVEIDLEVEIAKNRGGQLGSTAMIFTKKFSLISER